jgi:NTE family protein
MYAGAAVVGAGCAATHYPINAPLDKPSTQAYALADANNTDSLFIQISFSGGGTRAAALAYGVLAELRAQSIYWDRRERRLLDEIDLITATSGGSILAAYYALYGEQTFSTFEGEFLLANLQDELKKRILFSPVNWWRLTSPRFGRSDIFAELLDERLFKGATFAFWATQSRPRVLIAASNISTGERFEFTPVNFEMLCSDIATFPIARAVAASSALPVVLSPITVWDYRDACPISSSTATPAGGEGSNHPSKATKTDPAAIRYVHLLDGGLADNLGARGTPDFVERAGGIIGTTRISGYRGVRKAVFIMVNAETASQPMQDRSPDVPGVVRAITALVDIPINHYSSETLSRMRATVVAWEREVKNATDAERADVFVRDAKFYLIEISLAAAPDPTERERFMNVPTTLTLDQGAVQMLIDYGRKALRESPEFKTLMRDISADGGR